MKISREAEKQLKEFHISINRIKSALHKEIKNYMMDNLFNHRKKKEGLISLQNQLINDIEKYFLDWEKSTETYLAMKIRTGGFRNLKGKGN
jgi:hypothetical protein